MILSPLRDYSLVPWWDEWFFWQSQIPNIDPKKRKSEQSITVEEIEVDIKELIFKNVPVPRWYHRGIILKLQGKDNFSAAENV